MSKVFIPIISEELQSYVRNNQKVENIYFDKDNHHYFNVFSLRKDSKDETPPEKWELYGSGLYSHQQIIPGIFNVDKKKETISKGNPETLIVATLTRQQILTAQIKRAGTTIAANVANSTDAEKGLMLESLVGSDVAAILRGLASGQLKVVSTSQKDKEEEPLI